MSIIAFNMRLTGLTSKRWMIVHWTFFALMVSFAILVPALSIGWMSPPRARWDLVYAGKMDTSPRQNLNPVVMSYFFISIHVASDVLLLSFFAIVLWKLKMSWAVKIRLLMVFAVGAISFIAAIQWQLAMKQVNTDTLCEFRQARFLIIPSLIILVFRESQRSNPMDTCRFDCWSHRCINADLVIDICHLVSLHQGFFPLTVFANPWRYLGK